MTRKKESRFYNWESILGEKKDYDFIIGEHYKGRIYGISQYRRYKIDKKKETTTRIL